MKNSGTLIAIFMVAGLFIFGIGLDWEQTQVAWKMPFSTPMMIIGGILFALGFGWLCIGTKRGG
jgi:predicted benzoate:H+ symporter BenE